MRSGWPASCDRPDIAASALTESDCPLTERELQVLRASRTGASASEIAVQVHLAPGTVRNYLSAAMSKLGSARGTRPPTAPGSRAGSDLAHPPTRRSNSQSKVRNML